MKKFERLYCIIVGMNLALLVLALIMNFDLENYQTQQYIGLSFALSILTSIGIVAYYYYQTPDKIVWGAVFVILFHMAFWFWYQASRISSKKPVWVCFAAFVMCLIYIGIFFIGRYIHANSSRSSPRVTLASFNNPTYQFNTFNPSGQQYFQSPFAATNLFSIILYHGTPKIENAIDILNYGFLIGHGNSYGTGLYLADLYTAKNYARGTGSIVQVQMVVPPHQIVDYNEVAHSFKFLGWFLRNFSLSHGDSITNYTLKVLKKRFLKVNENFYVAVAHRTTRNERVIFEGLNILGMLDAYGNPV